MKRIKIWCAFIVVLFLSHSASAHRGGLDGNGGHWDRKAGTYHCHRPECIDKDGANLGSQENFPTRKNPGKRYNRKNWTLWIDADGDCQNTRAEVLIRDSFSPVKFKRNRGCVVSWGKWIGPYTGKIMTKASDVDIDHIVPLKHAWKSGAADWAKNKKRAFANDFENLLAVDDATNQAKGDKGPARWKPPLKSFWCEYARRWRRVKEKYDLFISAREERSLKKMELTCDGR